MNKKSSSIRLKRNAGVELVSFDKGFLDESFNWLSDPEVAHLTGTGPITKESQLAFFKSLPGRNDYMIWGVKINNQKAGAAGIKHLDEVEGEYWGYIGQKEFWGKGYGTEMCEEIIAKARRMKLSLLRLKVLRNNVRAYSLYTKFGFQEQAEKDGWVEMILLLK